METGRKISLEEEELLIENSQLNYPSWLISEQSSKSLIEKIFTLTEEEDASEMGVEMQFMTIVEQIEESVDSYPGKVATKLGYFPVGKCLEGSGDPYFIKDDEGIWNIYRIPHDCIINNSLNIEEIEYVCKWEDLLLKNN